MKIFWAKDKNGNWLSGYTPNNKAKMINGEWSGWWGPYYEGSALSYSCSVPQDIARLIRLHGGKDKFISFLDNIFEGLITNQTMNQACTCSGIKCICYGLTTCVRATFIIIHLTKSSY